MGQIFAEQDRQRYQQKCKSAPSENRESGSISGATGLGNTVETEKQSPRTSFIGESDEISPAAEKVEGKRAEDDPFWDGYIGER